MASNFITAPDFLPMSISHSIVLVDAPIEDIETIALVCKTCPKDFDIYLGDSSSNIEWLVKVAKSADVVLMYNEPDNEVKTAFKANSKTYVIGDTYASPAEYLIMNANG